MSDTEIQKFDPISNVDGLLKTYCGNVIDFCYEIIEQINDVSYDDQVLSIMELCKQTGKIKSDKTKQISIHISEELLKTLENMYGDYVDETLKTALKKSYQFKYKEKEFYELLWSSIADGRMFTGTNEKAFALYYILIDKRIPYYYLDHCVKMDQISYEKYINNNIEKINKIKFILSNDVFDQYTEEAAEILDVIIAADSYEEQVVILTAILIIMREERKKIIDFYKKALNEVADDD